MVLKINDLNYVVIALKTRSPPHKCDAKCAD